MKVDDFELLAKTVYEQSGLVVSADKAYLLESRLGPVARRYGVKTIEELVAMMRQRRDPTVVKAVTEAMTTNETLFFRDTKPFEQFRRLVLPELLAARSAKRHLRIWSAASSSGQEPYSLAMILREEAALLAGWRIEIIGTDISQEIIERARKGIYSQFEVQRGLPIQMLMKYFKPVEDRWQLTQEIRDMVQYREFNLLHDTRSLGVFDVVFCRNVLIYFDQATKGQVLARIAQVMHPDGMLYLGGAETVLGISDRFEPLPSERGLYRPTAKAKQSLSAPLG
jgi:chemotaxis protein methyltransferase CheR